MEGITNIAKTISASEDDEVWLELIYFRDRKQKDEVSVRMQNDERMGYFGQRYHIRTLRHDRRDKRE